MAEDRAATNTERVTDRRGSLVGVSLERERIARDCPDAGSSPTPASAETTTTYLDYLIRNRDGHLTVFTPAGFLLIAGRIQIATARRIIRHHRGEWART